MQRFWFRPMLLLTIVCLMITGQVGRVVAESGDAMSPGATTSVGSSICGIKFNDLNGNGVQDGGEPGLSAFVFELLDAGGNVVALSTLSAINPLGSFCFTGIAAGSYTVREKPKQGWNLTYPPSPGTYSVTFGAGTPNPQLLFGNTQAPPISSACGIKFNDLNGNGIQESTEPGLSGFVFELLDSGGNVVALSPLSAINPLGTFCFTGIAPGTYTVREKPKQGWGVTYPPAPGTYSVTFGYVTAPPQLVFGNKQLPLVSSACGIKFNDLNGNGIQESTEPGLSGFVFELLDAAGNVVALSPLSAINPLGTFCFTGSAPGTYTVREKPKQGWNQTYPPALGTYSVSFGYVVAPPSLIFGNTASSGSNTSTTNRKICGNKFNDINGNGVQDSGEPFLDDWTFQLLDAAGNVVATASTATDGATTSLGQFCFDNVKDGTYTVREVAQAGWMQTVPGATGSLSVSVGPDTTPGNLLFGNTQVPTTGTVCGTKFEDVNGNGKQDPGESGLGGWIIQITDESGNGVAKVETREDGTFCFEPLRLGSYTVAEVMQPGWQQTMPGGSGTYDVELRAAQLESRPLLFGNMQVPAAGTVCGIKFEDRNGNGTQDAGEIGLSGWTIQAMQVAGNVVASAVTGRDGTYCITGLRPDVYTFGEVMQPGYQQTFPGRPGFHTLRVVGGQNPGSYNFGNEKEPESCCMDFSFQGGRPDNFSTANGAEPAQPSSGLVQIMPSTAVYSGFDGDLMDRKVAHTFALPTGNCIKSAKLEFRANPIGVTPATSWVDYIGLVWSTPAGGSSDDMLILRSGGTPVWGGFFGNWFWFPGLLPSAWDPVNYSGGHVFSYDLANLPGGVNLIPTLNAQRSLDFVVEDDTRVDYARLNVTFCECANSDDFDHDFVDRPRPVAESPAIRLVVDSREATVDGEVKRLTAPAVIRDGSTLLPFRGFGDVLGATVQWDPAERRAIYLLGDTKVEVWIGQRTARVNGEAFTLSIAPLLIDGTTYVPVRSIVEALGLSVEYNPVDRSIRIFYSWSKL